MTNPQESKNVQPISRSSTIGDVVSKHPEVIETLLGLGVHCVGCHVAFWESLEDGLRSHGFDEPGIDRAVEALNKVAIQSPSDSQHPISTENQPSSLCISDKAAEKIKEFIAKENAKALRISVIPGGCSGFQYGFDLEENPNPDDVVRVENGVTLYLDRETADFLSAARIEYVDSIQGSGFRINNPKAKVGCGCGKSFSA